MKTKQTIDRPLKLRESVIGLLALIALAMVFIAVPQHASAVSLKPTSVITDTTIKLGDVFDGLDHKEDRILGAAPRPGQDMVLNARTLMRIAIALDLDWRPSSAEEQIVLTRAATVIDENMIKDAVKNALSAEGVSGSYDLLIPNEMSEMILPHDADASVEIINVSYRPDQDKFEATVVAPNKEKPLSQMRVSGSIERLASVPVLRNNMQAGEIISLSDIDMSEIPAKMIQDDMVLSADDLVGMAPRRVLFGGKTIKSNEIEAPRIVGRGEIVTMLFEAGGLSLTAEGKALEFGAKGDIIRVVNTSSSQPVQARVTGVNQVSVTSF